MLDIINEIKLVRHNRSLGDVGDAIVINYEGIEFFGALIDISSAKEQKQQWT